MHVIGALFVSVSGILLLLSLYQAGKAESPKDSIERLNSALLEAELAEFKRKVQP